MCFSFVRDQSYISLLFPSVNYGCARAILQNTRKMSAHRKLVQSELEYEAQRILDGEWDCDDGSISGDNDSLDEYLPSEEEHYISSNEEEPCVLERNLDADNYDNDGSEGPCPKKKKKAV